MKILKLKGIVKNFDWGEVGKESLVARLAGEAAEPNRNYAELWFGAHPSGVAQIIGLEQDLRTFLADNNDFIGEKVKEKFNAELPFLFKILSIKKPLSIQLHPNLEQAKDLHTSNPQRYPDSNHKPEVAVALSEIELLYGFRTKQEILKNLQQYQSLTYLFSGYSSNELLFEKLLLADQERITKAKEILINEINNKNNLTIEDNWVKKIINNYASQDTGIFAFYLLKYWKIQPGQAVFVKTGVPHAYLKGNLAECMATSDNVVRCGLTNKYCDRENLLKIIDSGSIDSIQDIRIDLDQQTIYKTNAEEFELAVIKNNMTINAAGPKLFFSVDAAGTLADDCKIKPGDAYLVADQEQQVNIKLNSGTLFYVSVPI